jgi:hypothetical protein
MSEYILTHKHQTHNHAASGWRIHCGVEVTELSTNKQLSLSGQRLSVQISTKIINVSALVVVYYCRTYYKTVRVAYVYIYLVCVCVCLCASASPWVKTVQLILRAWPLCAHWACGFQKQPQSCFCSAKGWAWGQAGKLRSR